MRKMNVPIINFDDIEQIVGDYVCNDQEFICGWRKEFREESGAALHIPGCPKLYNFCSF